MGKTSLIKRFDGKEFDETYKQTVDVATSPTIVVDGVQFKFVELPKSKVDPEVSMEGIDGVFYVASKAKASTFFSHTVSCDLLREDKIPVMLLVTKSDLDDDEEEIHFTEAMTDEAKQDLKEFAKKEEDHSLQSFFEKGYKENGFYSWCFVSSKTGENIESALNQMVKLVTEPDKKVYKKFYKEHYGPREQTMAQMQEMMYIEMRKLATEKLKDKSLPHETLITIAEKGTKYDPAILHYAYDKSITRVYCDNCKKTITSKPAFGFNKYDLCLECAEPFIKVEKKIDQNEEIHVPLTQEQIKKIVEKGTHYWPASLHYGHFSMNGDVFCDNCRKTITTVFSCGYENYDLCWGCLQQHTSGKTEH